MKETSLKNWLTTMIWGIVIFGIVMITSVSVFESNDLMVKIYGRDVYCQEKQGSDKECLQTSYFDFSREIQVQMKEYGEQYCGRDDINCNGFYLFRHIKSVFVGLIVFLFASIVPLGFWKKLALPMFGGSILLLILLLATSIGGEWGTAKSWINISFLPSIQPSEIAKMGLIFYLGIWMEKKEREVRSWDHGFMPFVILMIPIVVLLALQPDFGSLLVIASIAAVMFFVAGGNLIHIFLGATSALLLASIPLMLANCDPDAGEKRGQMCYIVDRLQSYAGLSADEDDNYQVEQSLIAVGSGQMFGVGIGESGMRYGWLPEIQSDTIFAAAGEELGFFRMIFLVGAFLAISLLGFQVAKNARNRFEMLVASGITAWITFQAFINMAVVLKIFPVTGITLPFVSYGGSSLVTLLFAAGVLIKISKFSSTHADTLPRRRVRRTYRSRPRYRY